MSLCCIIIWSSSGTKCVLVFEVCKQDKKNFGFVECTGIYKTNTYGNDVFQYPLDFCISSYFIFLSVVKLEPRIKFYLGNISGSASSFYYTCTENNQVSLVSYPNEAFCDGDSTTTTYEHDNNAFIYAVCGGEDSTPCGYAKIKVTDCNPHFIEEILPIQSCDDRDKIMHILVMKPVLQV